MTRDPRFDTRDLEKCPQCTGLEIVHFCRPPYRVVACCTCGWDNLTDLVRFDRAQLLLILQDAKAAGTAVPGFDDLDTPIGNLQDPEHEARFLAHVRGVP